MEAESKFEIYEWRHNILASKVFVTDSSFQVWISIIYLEQVIKRYIFNLKFVIFVSATAKLQQEDFKNLKTSYNIISRYVLKFRFSPGLNCKFKSSSPRHNVN